MTSDSDALAAARTGFILVGALNTVLVTRIARRWGTAASVVAGEPVRRLVGRRLRGATDPPGGAGHAHPALRGGPALPLGVAGASRWWLCAAGAVLGLGPAVKIWNIVPVLVVLAWHTHTRGPRSALTVTAAAAVSATCVVLPFALADPSAMLRLVLLDQLGRPRTPDSLVTRLEGITGADVTPLSTAASGRAALMTIVGSAVVLAAVIAWRARRGRLWVALLATEVTVILASPSYYRHYAAYAAAALPLVVGAAASLAPRRLRTWTAAGACVALGLVIGSFRVSAPQPFPAALVRQVLPQAGCVHADSPGALALLDVLSRDEDRGCDVRIDVSGQTYDTGSRDKDGRAVPRDRNQRWQSDAVQYLTSGSATVIVRGEGNGFSAATEKALRRGRTLVRIGGVRVLLPTPAPRQADSPDVVQARVSRCSTDHPGVSSRACPRELAHRPPTGRRPPRGTEPRHRPTKSDGTRRSRRSGRLPRSPRVGSRRLAGCDTHAGRRVAMDPTGLQGAVSACGRLSRSGAEGFFCHGHLPVISSSSVKLRNVRMSTIPARTPTLCSVGVTATVRMMSAATSSSRPSRIERPSC